MSTTNQSTATFKKISYSSIQYFVTIVIFLLSASFLPLSVFASFNFDNNRHHHHLGDHGKLDTDESKYAKASKQLAKLKALSDIDPHLLDDNNENIPDTAGKDPAFLSKILPLYSDHHEERNRAISREISIVASW